MEIFLILIPMIAIILLIVFLCYLIHIESSKVNPEDKAEAETEIEVETETYNVPDTELEAETKKFIGNVLTSLTEEPEKWQRSMSYGKGIFCDLVEIHLYEDSDAFVSYAQVHLDIPDTHLADITSYAHKIYNQLREKERSKRDAEYKIGQKKAMIRASTEFKVTDD